MENNAEAVQLKGIKPVYIENQMKSSYIAYAMSVIISRALPDVRDGLKPVHRRILYAMQEAGMTPSKPYKKSARIVGEVLGKFHPHGDSSVYDATVRLAQDFSTRYPLVDGHGNMGSVDGDSAAAMRYTEVRMSKISEEVLADIAKDTVDFIPNYDESLKEPVVLPTKIPNLLVNGSSGIAVGMATNIPPHNLGEIIDALILLINNPQVTLDEIMTIVKGPDYPTGGIICGRSGIKQAYSTGRGIIVTRAKAQIEKMANGKQRILVSEIPYMVNKAKLIEKIADLKREKTIDEISDLRDESDRSGMRIVIELKRDTDAQVVLNQLYKHTQLQESFGVIMLALVDGRPKVLNLLEVLNCFLRHREDVVTRRCLYELKKAQARQHILEGLKIALDHIDQVVAIIRASKTAEIAKQTLMNTFTLSDLQAQAILDLRLQRLAALEREKIEAEYQEVIKQIEWLMSVLGDESKLLGVIKDELLDIKRRFSDDRRTVVLNEAPSVEKEDLIAEEDIVVLLTNSNYIKRLSLDNYKSQKRGGRGVNGITTRTDDYVRHLTVTTTHNFLLFFTSRGRVFKVKAHEIPETGRGAKGTPVTNYIDLEDNEQITTILPMKTFEEGQFLFMATRNGIVKKTEAIEFDTTRKHIFALTLDDNDELVSVDITNGEKEVFIATSLGQAIRFPENKVRAMGRVARGVCGIKLQPNDRVIGMVIPKNNDLILSVTEHGIGKQTDIEEYRLQSRGGQGVVNIKVSDKSGLVVGVCAVQGDEELILVSSQGVVIRTPVNEVSSHSRYSQGVRLMALGENDIVKDIALC